MKLKVIIRFYDHKKFNQYNLKISRDLPIYFRRDEIEEIDQIREFRLFCKTVLFLDSAKSQRHELVYVHCKRYIQFDMDYIPKVDSKRIGHILFWEDQLP